VLLSAGVFFKINGFDTRILINYQAWKLQYLIIGVGINNYQNHFSERNLQMADFDIRARYNDPNRIAVTEASQRFFELIKTIEDTETRKLITRNGKVIAALVPLSEIAFIDEVRANQGGNQLHINNT